MLYFKIKLKLSISCREDVLNDESLIQFLVVAASHRRHVATWLGLSVTGKIIVITPTLILFYSENLVSSFGDFLQFLENRRHAGTK